MCLIVRAMVDCVYDLMTGTLTANLVASKYSGHQKKFPAEFPPLPHCPTLCTGKLPDFLKETAAVRDDPSWRGAPPAPGMVDRRVEITGPVVRRMVINALNSGASTFMADFEGEVPHAAYLPASPPGCTCRLSAAGHA